MDTCPVCGVEPCVCGFSADELAEAARALTPAELRDVAKLRADNLHLAVEVAQFLQHVHDIAELLAERMDGLPEAQAEALLEQELVRLAVLAKQLEARSGNPEIASSVGFKLSAVLRTRVSALLKRR